MSVKAHSGARMVLSGRLERTAIRVQLQRSNRSKICAIAVAPKLAPGRIVAPSIHPVTPKTAHFETLIFASRYIGKLEMNSPFKRATRTLPRSLQRANRRIRANRTPYCRANTLPATGIASGVETEAERRESDLVTDCLTAC